MTFDSRSPIDLEVGWKFMDEGITKLKKILEGDEGESFSAEQYMMLYTTIYNMCTQKPPHDHSEQLYSRYRESFILYIQQRVLPSLNKLHDEHLLRQFVFRWQNHKLMIRWLSRFFNYLDRYYIQRHNLHTLNDVGLIVFRDHVYNALKKKARDAVLKQIEAEREGEQIDTDLLRDVLAIFQEVGMGSLELYQEDFEESLLKDTAAYYSKKAAAWIEEDSSPEYLIKVESSLAAEEARVDKYLHIDTKTKLLKEAETQLLAEHQMEILEKEHSGCSALLHDDKKEDLSRMARLFGRISKGLDPMAEIFKKHVETEGLKLVQQASNAAEAKKERPPGDKPNEASAAGGSSSTLSMSPENLFLRGAIQLHDTYMAYVTECFSSSSLFHKSLKEAFESFCNKSVAGLSPAELMASFCDSLLKKGGGEKLSEEDLDAVLDKVVRLLAYISDKDLFSEFYRKRLGRRLLYGTSASEDAEKGVLTRLKQQCGQQFTSKMEGMVQDLQLAKEKEKQFKDWLDIKRIDMPMEINVTVLTTGFWPTYKSLDLSLPEDMMAGVEHFSRFHEEYNQKMRKLTWQLGLGSVHIKASFDKQYELILQPLQAAILLALDAGGMSIKMEDGAEDAGKYVSYAEIQDRTKLPDEDLVRALHSVTMAKHKLLVKRPESKSISKSDCFAINMQFSDRARRIRVPLPPVDDRRKVQEDVDKDRKYTIEAAIVRIMKSRKTLQHSGLVGEVVSQLQKMFQPDIKVIKRCIEGLIERDFLERDPNNKQVYKYMA